MTDDLEKSLLPQPGEATGPAAIDPVAMARRDQKASLPKRFYKQVSLAPAEGRFSILLDGKPVRTPSRQLLQVPGHDLAAGLVEEWAAQEEHIDPARMPLTRIVNSALDGVARNSEVVLSDIVKYSGSDLLCYRAGEPDTLVAEQAAAWDPLIVWMREDHDAAFILAEGVMFASQPDSAIAAFRTALAGFVGEGAPRVLRLAAVHVMTTLTGSAILALAVVLGRLSTEEAWAAAHVDEDFQIRLWGEDAEAAARRAGRWQDMQAAARVAAESAAN